MLHEPDGSEQYGDQAAGRPPTDDGETHGRFSARSSASTSRAMSLKRL
jgi:hypothetical protein